MRAKLGKPSLRPVAIRAMGESFFIKEVGPDGSRAREVCFFGNMLFEFAISCARRKLELFGEEIESALEANFESRLRNSRAWDGFKTDFGFFHDGGRESEEMMNDER